MTRIALLLLAALLGCKEAPDCSQLLHDRNEARSRLEYDQIKSERGDAYASASLSYDRDELRRAERRYDDACLR